MYKYYSHILSNEQVIRTFRIIEQVSENLNIINSFKIYYEDIIYNFVRSLSNIEVMYAYQILI